MIEQLIKKNRSCRSFDPSKPITREQMIALVDLARQTASGMNKQPLRYRILTEQRDLDAMVSNARFGTALKDMKLPPVGMEPTGYIIILTDKEVGSPASLAMKDVGIAAQTSLLAATEQGFGGCMLGSYNPDRVLADYAIDARYEVQLVIALGTPAETAVMVEPKDGSLTYYRDDSGTHYVPKRALKDILI